MKNSKLDSKMKLPNLIIGTKSSLRGYMIVFALLALSVVICIMNINSFIVTGNSNQIEIFGNTVVFERELDTDRKLEFNSNPIEEFTGSWNFLVQIAFSIISILIALIVFLMVSFNKWSHQE